MPPLRPAEGRLTVLSDTNVAQRVESFDQVTERLTAIQRNFEATEQGFAARAQWPVNVKDFRAKGDGATDDYAAFVAAHDALPAGGGAIYIPPGTYLLSATWVITKPVRVVGAGTGSDPSGGRSATVLRPAAGVSGIQVDNANSQCSRFEGFSVWSRSTTSGTDDGMLVRGHATVLDQVEFENFGRDGLSIDTSGGGNANNCEIRCVRSTNNRRHGFYTHAVDSNVVGFYTCDASNNGGWGFYTDSAQCAFVAPHAAANTLGGFYDNGNSNQYFIPYVEGGTGYNVTLAGSYTLWLAGNFSNPTVTNSGAANIVIRQGKLDALEVVGAAQVGSLLARTATGATVVFGVRSSGDSVDRVVVQANGAILLGSGAAARDTQLSRSAVGVLLLDNALGLTARSATGVPNVCLFVDSADNKLKFKDSGGTTNALY